MPDTPVTVARIIKPFGLRGRIVVESLTDFPDRFAPGSNPLHRRPALRNNRQPTPETPLGHQTQGRRHPRRRRDPPRRPPPSTRVPAPPPPRGPVLPLPANRPPRSHPGRQGVGLRQKCPRNPRQRRLPGPDPHRRTPRPRPPRLRRRDRPTGRPDDRRGNGDCLAIPGVSSHSRDLRDKVFATARATVNPAGKMIRCMTPAK